MQNKIIKSNEIPSPCDWFTNGVAWMEKGAVNLRNFAQIGNTWVEGV